MNLRNTVLTLSLLTASVIAASGCDRGVNVIDFAGQETAANSESVTPTENTENSGDTIVPDNTGSPSTDTGTTETTPDPETPTDTGSDTHEEKYCPAGTASEDGNGTLCCRIDNPQICMIIDPVPPGGLHPHFPDHLPDAEVVLDEPTTPPDHGGGGTPYDPGNIDLGCSQFQHATGGRRMKVTTGKANETDAITGKNNCIRI